MRRRLILTGAAGLLVAGMEVHHVDPESRGAADLLDDLIDLDWHRRSHVFRRNHSRRREIDDETRLVHSFCFFPVHRKLKGDADQIQRRFPIADETRVGTRILADAAGWFGGLNRNLVPSGDFCPKDRAPTPPNLWIPLEFFRANPALSATSLKSSPGSSPLHLLTPSNLQISIFTPKTPP